MRNVLITDDHPIVRQGIARILTESISDLRVAEAAGVAECLGLLAAEQWDLVILDVRLGEDDGFAALRRIRQSDKPPRVLILSMYPADQFAPRAVAAGAEAYLEKGSDPGELVTAVRTLLAGRPYVSPWHREVGVRPGEDNPHDLLSDREYQVLRMIGAGQTVSEIAEALALSVKTVSTYRTRVLEKMRLRTNAELMRYAMEKRLVQ